VSVTGPTDLATHDDIQRLVVDFYRQAAMDDLLGPVFAAANVDWPAHIDTLTAFWSWQLLGERGYEGNPLRAHEPVHQRTPFTSAHYDRWITLFCETIDEGFAGPTADAAKFRGRKMAAALQRLMSGVSDAGAVPITPTLTTSPDR